MYVCIYVCILYKYSILCIHRYNMRFTQAQAHVYMWTMIIHIK